MVVNELKDVLKLLDRFVGHYPIFFYLLDADNRLVWFNRFMSRQIPDVAVGMQLNCPRSLLPCEDECRNCEEAGKGYPDDVRRDLIKVPFKDGHDRFLEFFNFPVLTSKGVSGGNLRVGLDVTHNEALQTSLRNQERRFTTIVNSSSDAVIFIDPQEKVQEWSSGASEIFGYETSEIVGRSMLTLVPPELIELGELNYVRRELAAKGELKRYETRRLTNDGRSIYVEISSAQMYDDKGTFLGTSEIIKDIGSRKELEFELLRTILELSKLNELNEILHSTYDVEEILRIILIAITAGEGLRFNRAFMLLVNPESGFIEGSLAIGPSDQEEASRIWSELDRDHRYLRDIVKVYRIDLDGADKTVNELVRKIEVPLDDENHIFNVALRKKRLYQIQNGRLMGPGNYHNRIGEESLSEFLKSDTFVITPLFSKATSLGLIIADNCINQREITTEDLESLKLFANQASSAIENARLYETLQQGIQDLQGAYKQLEENQEKLVRAERLAAIGEMSAKIAHEIRNPLVSIGGFARLIEKKIPDEPNIKKYAGIIKDQVSHLEYILGNILNVANPPKPNRHEVSVNQIVRQAVQVLDSAMQRREIELAMSLSEADPLISGDEKMLAQMMMNLLKNAIEALDGRSGGGMITIQTSLDNNIVGIEVGDNGSGIAKDVLNKIFEKFFTTKSSGTGLGLSIVNQIVEAHQGDVRVESNIGKGTKFFLSFPIGNEK